MLFIVTRTYFPGGDLATAWVAIRQEYLQKSLVTSISLRRNIKITLSSNLSVKSFWNDVANTEGKLFELNKISDVNEYQGVCVCVCKLH